MIILDDLIKYLLTKVLLKGYHGELRLIIEDGQITRVIQQRSIKESILQVN